MADTIHIACATDSKYLPHCAAMLRSLVRQMPDERLSIHIVYSGVADTERALLDGCVPIDSIIWYRADSTDELAIPRIGHISAATYLRLQLDKLLPPEINRILYLDVDMIMTGSLRNLWETPLENKSLAAVRDLGLDPVGFATRYALQPGQYFNAGMLLLDLARIRKSGGFARTIEIIETQGDKLEYSDQDALNLVFWNDWLPVCQRWNFQREHIYEKSLRESEAEMGGLPSIIHFTESLKPWQQGDWHPYRWLYWRHLIGTPFFGKTKIAENITTFTFIRSFVKFHILRRWWP